MRPFAILVALLACAACCSAAAAGPAIGSPAPDLGATTSFNTKDGGAVTLASLKGRVVLIDFWATWCGPCVAAIPHVQELHEKYKDRGLVVIGHTDASSQKLPEFIQQKKITYTITVGPDIGDAWGVSGIPAVFLVDPEGRVAWSGHPSQLTDGDIEPLLARVRMAPTPVPSFAKASASAKVAAVEQSIAGGKVGAGVKALERLAADAKKADDAGAATATLEAITVWKTERDADLAKLREAGDVFAAATLAEALAASWAGHDHAKPYRDAAAELKKDPGHAAGREFQKLAAIPPAQRGDPRFAKMVEGFLKKHPEGYYAEQAKALTK